ncbi:MAG: hypothetical protein RRC34_01785 [Lentisphaeria bacterium]|nr:hypothetical protein [Lentisphaeria bacterium]
MLKRLLKSQRVLLIAQVATLYLQRACFADTPLFFGLCDSRIQEAVAVLREDEGRSNRFRGAMRALESRVGARTNSAATCAAKAALAEYYCVSGKPAKGVAEVAEFSDYDKKNLAPPRLLGFLAHAKALDADGRLREAVKRLDYATENSEGLSRARIMTVHAGLYRKAKAFKKSIELFEAARNYGNKFYRPKRISEGEPPEKVTGADDWAKFRKHLETQLTETRKQYDIDRYGLGFVYYRIARRADACENYDYALAAYKQVSRVAPNSVYSEAAECYYGYVLEKQGKDKSAEKYFIDFINRDPLGLYRGEVLEHLGEVKLTRDLDARAARQYFARTVEWVQKVRICSRDIELYVVPDKARGVTAPALKPLEHNDIWALAPVKETPDMVVNRRTADWYLDRLAWRALFSMGFIAFYDEDYAEAKEYWARALKHNKQLQEQYAKYLGSFYRRLMCACRGGHLIATRDEMTAFNRKGPKRLKVMTAQFYALWVRWERAETLYNDLLKNDRLNAAQTSVVLHCLASARLWQDDSKTAEALLKKIVTKYPRTPAAQSAYYSLAMKTSLPLKQKIEYLSKGRAINRNSDLGKKILFMMGDICYCMGDTDAAVKYLTEYSRRYSDHRFAELAQADLRQCAEREKKRTMNEKERKHNQ